MSVVLRLTVTPSIFSIQGSIKYVAFVFRNAEMDSGPDYVVGMTFFVFIALSSGHFFVIGLGRKMNLLELIRKYSSFFRILQNG